MVLHWVCWHLGSCQVVSFQLFLLGLTILAVPRHRCAQSMSTKSRLVLYPNLLFLLRISQEIYTNLGKNGLLERQEKEQFTKLLLGFLQIDM